MFTVGHLKKMTFSAFTVNVYFASAFCILRDLAEVGTLVLGKVCSWIKAAGLPSSEPTESSW